MQNAKRNELPGPLRRAAERFELWRRRHERGTHIPESLWSLAANLAVTYGVCKTASTLKLDYYSLKRRLSESAMPAAQARGGLPAFLDLPVSALAAPGECVIECENSDGARMRIHLKGVALPDLAALGRSLWSAE
jgi:hypothetical protein